MNGNYSGAELVVRDRLSDERSRLWVIASATAAWHNANPNGRSPVQIATDVALQAVIEHGVCTRVVEAEVPIPPGLTEHYVELIAVHDQQFPNGDPRPYPHRW